VEHWFRSVAPIASDHQHQVCDLVDNGTGNFASETTAFADRICAHVKLIAEAGGGDEIT
jgi:hypothetical protein